MVMSSMMRKLGTKCAGVGALTIWMSMDGGIARSEQDAFQLRQVQVVFRHGARTPFRQIDSHPQTPWVAQDVEKKKSLDGLAALKVVRRNEKTGEVVGEPLTEEEIESIDLKLHPGETLHGGALPARLTGVGMEQAVGLGSRLRKRYVEELGFLPSDWKTASAMGDVYVRSTMTERTIETAQGVLTGLYPKQITKDSPATIYLKSRQDKEWGVPHYSGWCPRVQQLFRQGTKKLNQPVCEDSEKLLQELMEHVKLYVPEDAGAFTLSMYRDQLSCSLAHDKEIPEGYEKVDNALERLNKFDTERLIQIFHGGDKDFKDEATRLQAGRLLVRIIESIENLNNGNEESHKLKLYSGHDWTIIMLLMCLDPNATNELTRTWPRFCADITIELWERPADGVQLVRVLMNGEPLKLPYLEQYATTQVSNAYSFASLQKALHRFTLAEHEIEELCKPK